MERQNMAKTRNIFIAVIVLIALNVIFMFTSLSQGQANQQSGQSAIRLQEQPFVEPVTLWLSRYEGQLVRTTFLETPPDLDKIFTTRLVRAEPTGIVLTFGNRRTVFFPYSNIISIEPM
jgi:hypothetical protein